MSPIGAVDGTNGFALDPWYYTRSVGPGVWLICEPQHVCSWLIEGSERAVLFDTGMGFFPIRPVAEGLTDRPISVINSHYHFDHVGGNWEFEDIAIHQIGAPLIGQEVPSEVLDVYMDYAHRQIEAAAVVRPLDREFFWIFGPEFDPRPFPPQWEQSSWKVRPTRPTRTLVDGEKVDLGDRSLTVIHAPGHSPDGICLLEERNGLFFGGDSSNTGPIYAHFPDSDLNELTRSAHRLADYGDAIRISFFCHYGRPVIEPDIFLEIANGLDLVVAEAVKFEPAKDVIGTSMLEAKFEHFSVTVPDPEAEQGLPGIGGGNAE